jgi:predicted transcriptional regulator
MVSEREAAIRAAEALAMNDEIVDAREVAGKEYRQMISLRMEPALISALRALADSRNESLSELMRVAAEQFIRANQSQRFHLRTTQAWETSVLAGTFVVSSDGSWPSPSASPTASIQSSSSAA